MLPEEIEKRIALTYQPGSITNYDLILAEPDFMNLFAPIDNVTSGQLTAALHSLGFDQAKIHKNDYFILINNLSTV